MHVHEKLIALMNDNKPKEFLDALNIFKKIPGFDIDQYNEHGFTLLHLAAMQDNDVFLKILLESKANLSLPIKDTLIRQGVTVLELCIENPYGQVLELTEAEDEKKTKIDEIKALTLFKHMGSKKLTEIAITERGHALLKNALIYRQLQVAYELIKAGAKLPNDITPEGVNYFLITGNIMNDDEMVQKIIREGKRIKKLNLDQHDANGLSPIHFATIIQNKKIAELLIEEGSDILLPIKLTNDKFPNFTVLDLSIRPGHYQNTDMALFYLQKLNQMHNTSYDKDIKDRKEAVDSKNLYEILNRSIHGSTLLGQAISLKHPRLCELLASAGADVNLPTDTYTCPIDMVLTSLRKEFASDYNCSFSIHGPLAEIMAILLNQPGIDLKRKYIGEQSLLGYLTKFIRLEDLPRLNNPTIQKLWLQLRILVLNAHRVDQKKLYLKDLKQAVANDEVLKRSEEYMNMFGYSINLEQLTQGITGQELIKSYMHFLESDEIGQKLNQIINAVYKTDGANYLESEGGNNLSSLVQIALSNIGQIPSNKEIQQNFDTKQITVLPVITSTKSRGDHAMTYLFYDDLCVRVNCGATVKYPDGTGGFTISQVGRIDKLRELMPKFQNSQVEPLDDHYLMGEFRAKCQLADMQKIKRDEQTVGNCTWKSSETLIWAIIFMTIYKELNTLNHIKGQAEAVQLALTLSSYWFTLFLEQDRKYAAEECQNLLKGHIPDRVYRAIMLSEKAFTTQRFEMEKSFLAEFAGKIDRDHSLGSSPASGVKPK